MFVEEKRRFRNIRMGFVKIFTKKGLMRKTTVWTLNVAAPRARCSVTIALIAAILSSFESRSHRRIFAPLGTRGVIYRTDTTSGFPDAPQQVTDWRSERTSGRALIQLAYRHERAPAIV